MLFVYFYYINHLLKRLKDAIYVEKIESGKLLIINLKIILNLIFLFFLLDMLMMIFYYLVEMKISKKKMIIIY